MVFKNRFIMGFVALGLMASILIVLFQQSKMQEKELDLTLPALSRPEVRGNITLPKWIGDFSQKETVYFISFWATWCEPCQRELPFFEELANTYPQDQFQVRLVNLDHGDSNVMEAKKMLANLAPSLTSVYEHEKTQSKMSDLPALPYHHVIDKNGKSAMSFFAPLADYQEVFKNRVQQLLAETASP